MLETKYGLNPVVTFCRSCIMSNQRPTSCREHEHTINSSKQTLHIDEEGICDACRMAEHKEKIDWNQREKELIELCNKYRGKGKSGYDCLCPGSGGKDSIYASHILREKYGMRVLTCTWSPNLYTDWGWRNFQNWIQVGGFDNYLCSQNGKTHRILTRLAVQNLFHAFQPFIIGQKGLAPKLAAMLDIPLIFYGENEAEHGNPLVDNNSAMRDYAYFTASDKNKIYLGGESIQSLTENYGLTQTDLNLYMPIDPQIIFDKKIEVHYLGYYLKWHPQEAFYYSNLYCGFEPASERSSGTYSKYNSIDDKIDDFHYYTTYIKFGLSRVYYDGSQEIRNKEITRDEAISLAKKYGSEFPERFSEEIFKYLTIDSKEFPVASKMFDHPIMDRDYFMELANTFRSPHLWKKEYGIWKLRHTVWNEEHGETNPEIEEDTNESNKT